MQRTTTRIALLAGLAAILTAAPDTAHAGGYDTPMLFSARNMGMGGTAVSYVGDGGAIYHNPAGLGQIGRFHAFADIGIFAGTLRASPSDDQLSIESERTVSPPFLAGVAGRLHDYIVIGAGAFPVAAAGGEYRYPDPGGGTTVDSTTLRFFEINPLAVALDISQIGLRVGVGYRMTNVTLERERATDGNRDLFLQASGWNFGAIRVGAQFQHPDFENLQIGINYRQRVDVDLESDKPPVLLGLTSFSAVETEFVLPSRIETGVRFDYADFGVAMDFLYTLNSENDESVFQTFAADGSPSLALSNIFQWTNEVTVRIGGEYRVLDGQLPLRVGYTFDGKTGNRAYPTAFGTPAAATHIATFGAGYQINDEIQVNFAYAYRTGSTTIREEEVDGACVFCGSHGNYDITLHGIYLDFSYDLGRADDAGADVPLDEEGDAEAIGEEYE